MVLLKDGQTSNDTWQHLNDDDTLPSGPIIVSVTRWHRDRASLAARNMPLGLQLDAGAEPAKLADDLHRFSVICLQFDSFTDGRPYSQACCCANGTDIAANCGREVTSCEISLISCGATVSMRWRSQRKRTFSPGKTPSRRLTSIINPLVTLGRLSPCTVAVQPRVIQSE